MKKLISVSLSVLMIALLFVPAFGAGGGSVTFVGPSAAFRNELDSAGNFIGDAYCFAKPVDPWRTNLGAQFEEDPLGDYVFYNESSYVTKWDIHPYYWEELAAAQRYSPVTYACGTPVTEDGEELVFFVLTSGKYNSATMTVLADNTVLQPDIDGAYHVSLDRDVTVRVVETTDDSHSGLDRSRFTVKMLSGEGYNLRPMKGQTYKYVKFDDDFEFRIQVKKNYTASAIKVSVIRNVDLNSGAADMDGLVNFLGGYEELKSTGVDEDGYRVYKVKNVQSDCRIIVSGVRENKSAHILSVFKEILRMIMNFLGIRITELEDFVGDYHVTVENTADDVLCAILAAVELDEENTFAVTAGSGLSFQLTKLDRDQDVKVWIYKADAEPTDENLYDLTWVATRDEANARTIYTAICYLDNVKSDMKVKIDNG
ncbi:MAG: hypothetical protein IJT27_06810 [Clostridia bacterium]|nr:hypothetical protein [Clostridia bacterium]